MSEYNITVCDHEDIPLFRITTGGITKFMRDYTPIDDDTYQLYLPSVLLRKDGNHFINLNRKLEKISNEIDNFKELDSSNKLNSFISDIASDLENECLVILMNNRDVLLNNIIENRLHLNGIISIENNIDMKDVSYIVYKEGVKIIHEYNHRFISGVIDVKLDSLGYLLEID